MKFKVYIHRRKTNNEVFYVGIAKIQKETSKYDRPSDTWKRSKEWKEVYKEFGRKVQIYKVNLSLLEAYREEIRLINYYGRRDLGTGILVNKTCGGDGGMGIPMPKGKDEPTSKPIVDVRTGKVVFYGYREAAEHFGVDKSHIGKVLRKVGSGGIAQFNWGLMLKTRYDYMLEQGIDPVAYLKKQSDIANRNIRKGYKRTKKQNQRMREIVKAQYISGKRVVKPRLGGENPMSRGVINVKTGTTWETCVQAARDNGMTRHQMSRRCHGRIEKDKRFKYILNK
tara:strand:- start:259 stop:1104 length:846 start_codon:yes stop_codon:yes gene_type:complete